MPSFTCCQYIHLFRVAFTFFLNSLNDSDKEKSVRARMTKMNQSNYQAW